MERPQACVTENAGAQQALAEEAELPLVAGLDFATRGTKLALNTLPKACCHLEHVRIWFGFKYPDPGQLQVQAAFKFKGSLIGNTSCLVVSQHN